MYKHIIETISTELNIQYENGIMKAIQDVGVIVDKEELVKALMYDRNQYDEGYRDGKKDALKWIPVSEGLPEPLKDVLVWYKYKSMGGTRVGELLESYDIAFYAKCGNHWSVTGRDAEVIAWAELPDPYKGE